MKKLLALLLIGIMLVSAGCGGSDGGGAGGKLSGTYSLSDEDFKISYTFSGNTLTVTMTSDGEVVMEGKGAYEATDGVIKFTLEDGEPAEEEYKLEGNKLTLINAWFGEDLELTKE